MAIDRGTTRLLLSEHATRPFRGSILQLGRQAILFNETQLRVWSRQAAVNLKQRDEANQVNGRQMNDLAANNLDDNDFFHLLAFDEVEMPVGPHDHHRKAILIRISIHGVIAWLT